MIKKRFARTILTLLSFLVVSLIPVAGVAARSNSSDMPRYPISDLGNCTSRLSCFGYCQMPENSPACWSWGESQKTSVLGETTTNMTNAPLEKKLQSLGVTFPIGELGNCASAADCRRYCDNGQNRETCTNFSRRIGFQKKQSVVNETEQQILLGEAKRGLGCSDAKDCRAVCQKNPTKCQDFVSRVKAKKDRITRDLLLEKAKKELGCTTFDACRAFCNNNPTRCEAFVKKFNLAPTPGPTANEESEIPAKRGCATAFECKAWCQENPAKCPGFTPTKLVPQTTTTPAKNTASPAP